MALIPHGFLNRSMFDMDSWFRPTLDIFDPFDDLDHALGRNLEWLTVPSFLYGRLEQPRVPRKYRVTLNCAGYNPQTIKTEVKDGKLLVHAKDESKDENGDYSTREFRKTYPLPENAEADKLVSFVTRQGQLVVEVPLKQEQAPVLEEDLFPKVVENQDGTKQVTMKCSLPENVDPSKLSVTCKDRDLIIKAEDVQEKEDTVSRKYFYKRCTMPQNTDLSALKCHFENNSLTIAAPVNPALESQRQIPIEFKKM